MILDTNALSAWADGDSRVFAPLASASDLYIPSIVIGEYTFGIRGSRNHDFYQQWLARYLPTTKIVPVSYHTAVTYAEVRYTLKQQGTPIPANDIWIAALAVQHQIPILSNDAHFDFIKTISRIPF